MRRSALARSLRSELATSTPVPWPVSAPAVAHITGGMTMDPGRRVPVDPLTVPSPEATAFIVARTDSAYWKRIDGSDVRHFVIKSSRDFGRPSLTCEGG